MLIERVQKLIELVPTGTQIDPTGRGRTDRSPDADGTTRIRTVSAPFCVIRHGLPQPSQPMFSVVYPAHDTALPQPSQSMFSVVYPAHDTALPRPSQHMFSTVFVFASFYFVTIKHTRLQHIPSGIYPPVSCHAPPSPLRVWG